MSIPKTQAIVLPSNPAGFAVLNYLRLARIPAVVLANGRNGHQVRSRYPRKVFLGPNADPDSALLEALSELRDRGGVILPTMDSHVLFMARHRALLERDFRLCIPSDEVVGNLIDKSHETRVLRRAGFELPATETDLPSDPHALIERLGTESIILKPKMPKSVIGVKTIHTRTAGDLSSVYRNMAEKLPDLIAQAYVPGGPSQLWLCNAVFNTRHELVSAFIYRKLRTKPVHNGVTTVGVSQWNAALMERVREFGRAMRYVGPADLEFKEDPLSGRYYYIETNTRFTLSCEFAARCGINQVAESWRLALGEDPQPRLILPSQNVYYANLPLDIQARRKAGESWPRILWEILPLLPRRRVGVVDFSLQDPWPSARRTLVLAIRAWTFPARRMLRPLRSAAGVLRRRLIPVPRPEQVA